MYYGARYDSLQVGRFLQADTLVPQPGDPQSLNRYAYTLNNPLRYTDPTGHLTEEELQILLGNEYDTLMNLWLQYDRYWLSVLINVQAGGILSASFLGGAELHFEGSGSNIKLNVYNGSHSSRLKDWQGQGVYRWQNPGMNETQSYAVRDALFNAFAMDNMLIQPAFDYGYDSRGVLRPEYRGAIPIIQSVDVTWGTATGRLASQLNIPGKAVQWPVSRAFGAAVGGVVKVVTRGAVSATGVGNLFTALDIAIGTVIATQEAPRDYGVFSPDPYNDMWPVSPYIGLGDLP